MEITLKTNVEIGQTLYYIKKTNKTVYAPCSVCENERKITITISGKDYRIDCPECAGEQIKGDEAKHIKIKEYSVHKCMVNKFIYAHVPKYLENQSGKWSATTTSYNVINPETLLLEKTTFADTDKHIQFFTEKEAAKAKAKELNRYEKQKVREFLANIGDKK